MTLISLQKVSVNYGALQALKEVDLEIYNNDFVGIIGPNGGGKTTLVKALLKAIPYSGSVIYSDDLTEGKALRIGYLPQITDLDRSFPISVEEVILSGLQGRKGLLGRYRKEDRERAVELMATCGITDLRSRPVGKLSGGQLQRTLLCRAMISEPRLLILDEPANFVDNQFERELYEILKELNKTVAIVMVSHDLGTITSHVKSIVCVNQHVHRHNSNKITPEQLQNYNCPIQLLSHGTVPHTVLKIHKS